MKEPPDEREVIELLVKGIGQPKPPYSKIGDDVAFLPSQRGKLVVKSDMLVGRTDVPKPMKLWQAARKSMVMCVSDFAAKGVRPRAALVSLGLPKGTTREEVKELALGFKRAKKEFSLEILGGDTNESDDLIIDCTMLGFSNRIIRRDGARPGDVVLVSGPFGYSAAGLRIIIDGSKADEGFKKKALDAVLMPQPRLQLGILLNIHKIPSSSIDSSDGLAISLYEVAEQSKVKVELAELPSTKEVFEFSKMNGIDVEELVLYGGEEYELVFTVPPNRLDEAHRLAASLKMKLIEIGKVLSGKGKVVMREDGRKVIKRRGWVHLK